MRKANDLSLLNIFLAIVIVLATFSGAQSASQKWDKILFRKVQYSLVVLASHIMAAAETTRSPWI